MNVNPPVMLVTVYPSSVVIMDEAGIDALGQNLAVACRGMPARELLGTLQGFVSGTTNYVIPASHNQFHPTSLPYITVATTLLLL